MYILIDGTEVTQDQIKSAFLAGNAALVHGHGHNKSTTGLKLDGEHMDTRGKCHSVWDEVWTTEPKTIFDCYHVSHVY